ncbi:MAG: outer membrane protein assembly factor BamD [Planctomycetaceae bacterium]|nr:outer membrane protein assembly factor BamD [Planctomycetaceae bacterium]
MTLLALLLLGNSGCRLFKPWQEDEYSRAKNAIEGYEDKEGNWIRPEGSRADKMMNSDVPKILRKIPGLGERKVDKDLARSTLKEANEIYQAALSTQDSPDRKELFRKAAKKYNQAGKHWASSSLAQDAYFMTAESYFFAEDYPKAEDSYVKLIKEYPRTRYQDRVDQRRMEIGNYWLQFPDKFYNLNFTDKSRPLNDTENHGKRVLEKMLLDSPTGRLADDVVMDIANTEFKRENWNEALDRYRDLITVYTDSPHQFDAHFLGAKSALLAYQGPQYSSEPLEQADKLLKQMVRQFSKQASERKEPIAEMLAEVKYRQAERLYDEATYRNNKQEYAAAIVYCDRILDNYPDTPFADKAQQIIDNAEGKPSVPTPYLHWMTYAFPTRDKVTPLLKPTQEEIAQRQALITRTRPKPTPNPLDPNSGDPQVRTVGNLEPVKQ